ncbi:unnamed protein product [Meloidogyne enterolobii]|uniref:Uncharacterized protein n=1 Tax=Meloidogyne enterolobii TaxID=390850 RepID=A0ACB0YMV6_MELEN
MFFFNFRTFNYFYNLIMSSSDESTKSRGVRAGAVRLRDSIRPAFAEDVYGGPRRSSSSEPRLPSSNAPANTNVSSAGSDLCISALAQRRSANLPKLRELCSGTSNELNISSTECPLTSARANLMDELEFVYADADSYETELAEFYTYSEMDEFALNFECFVKYMREQKKEPFWNKLTRTEKCSVIQGLAASFDSTEPEQRLQAARIILYILQGSYGDFSELEGKKQKAQSLADCSYHTNSRSKQRRRPSSSHNLGDIVENKSCNDGDDDSKSIDSCETRSGEDENETTSELGLPSKWFGPDHGTGDYESDCLINATLNAYLLYEQGLFQPLCSLLRLEVSLPFERYADHSRQSSVSNSRSTSHMDLTTGIPPEGGGGSASGTFERRRSRRSATLADNERIRVVLNCIYHMVESLRRDLIAELSKEQIFDDICAMFEYQKTRYQSPEHQKQRYQSAEHTFSHSRVSLERGGQSRLKTLRTQFITELEEPLEHSKMPLAIVLLDMMPTFVRAKNPHYPIKKVILLCWKVLLTTLGGIEFLREEKTRKRRDALLEPIEDTLEAAINMKPLTQSTGPSMGGGTGGERVVGELGSKIRLMPRARQFNRQVACSSATDGGWENKESITDGGWKNKKNKNSFKNKERDDNEILESKELISKSDADRCDDEFVDVNDAMPADDNNEEKGGEDEEEYGEQEKFSEHEIKKMAAVLKKPEDADLLDEILKELSVDEEDVEEGTKNKTISEDAIFYRDREPFRLLPKGAVKDDSEASGLNDTTANKQQQYNRHPLVAVQISESLIRRHKNECSGDSSNGGGDQTPKACQSPVKIASPWPPPPPPGLPWRSKVREEDVKNFLQHARQKYFNYQLPNDSTTLFGLPMPVQTSVAALRRNLYTSLGEVQLKAEERYNKYPFSQKEFIEETPTERLYSRILPEMAEYVIAILKANNDAVIILSDVLTPETDTNEVLSNSISLDLAHLGSGNVLEDNIRVAIDINRHKELIIKGASSIIILLLKHFRLNHVYQFENFAQYLVKKFLKLILHSSKFLQILANCMPLVLKFLDQNICRYFQSKHDLAPFNYPQCALYIVRNGNERPPLTADNVDGGTNTESPGYFRWRNVFSAINLLRVINKLVKGKQARTMMLVVYKSAPVLKRCMKAKLGIFQLYVLKLLKLQARYLGRQWRKTNMDIISAIYMRCRHRLNDDWAYANETTRTKSFDYHKEENELSIAIRRFNTRRYPYLQLRGGIAVADTSNDAEHPYQQNNQISDILSHSSSQLDELAGEWDPKVWEPMDNSLQTALAWEPVFSDRFLQNYEQWLEQEVYGHQTDWDGLLLKSRGLLDIYC